MASRRGFWAGKLKFPPDTQVVAYRGKQAFLFMRQFTPWGRASHDCEARTLSVRGFETSVRQIRATRVDLGPAKSDYVLVISPRSLACPQEAQIVLIEGVLHPFN